MTITLKDIINLLLTGDGIDISSLRGEIFRPTYKNITIDIETGTSKSETRIEQVSGSKVLKLGIQNVSDNLDTSKKESGAYINLANAETIAYPIFKYISEQQKEIDSLKDEINTLKTEIANHETRIKSLESKIINKLVYLDK